MLSEKTIGEKLRELRTRRGLTLDAVALETGISRAALSSYETNDYKDISHISVAALAKYYGVTTDYLLGLTQHKKRWNLALEELNLDDKTAALLRSGRFNNRLICEMISHEGFARFLLDIEIYVDRIASMRIKDLNTMLEATRMMLAAKNEPGKNALDLRVLELAAVNEDEYFAGVVSEDLMKIIRDIREAHKKDVTTADKPSGAAIFFNGLNEYLSMKGSPQEKQMRSLCIQLGINYDRLSPEEVVVMLSVFKKSSLVVNHGRMRGKAHRMK